MRSQADQCGGTGASACPPAINGRASRARRAAFSTLSGQPSRMLILTALLAVYIVLGILYESLVHPITIISTLAIGRRRRSASRCMITGSELSIIALIGIILLIGIVQEKRHHDDRLRASGGTRGRKIGRRSHLPGLSASLQANHDDHAGGASWRTSAGTRRRRGRRTSHAPRRQHRWRTHLLAGAYALYHSRGLSLLCDLAPPRAQQGCGVTSERAERFPELRRSSDSISATIAPPHARLSGSHDVFDDVRITPVASAGRAFPRPHDRPDWAPVVAPEHVANSPPRTIVAPRACFRSRRRRKRTPRRIARAAARQWRRSRR